MPGYKTAYDVTRSCNASDRAWYTLHLACFYGPLTRGFDKTCQVVTTKTSEPPEQPTSYRG
jgi:hypothetical protein